MYNSGMKCPLKIQTNIDHNSLKKTETESLKMQSYL